MRENYSQIEPFTNSNLSSRQLPQLGVPVQVLDFPCPTRRTRQDEQEDCDFKSRQPERQGRRPGQGRERVVRDSESCKVDD